MLVTTRKVLAYVLPNEIFPMNRISCMRYKPNVLMISWCNALQHVDINVLIDFSAIESNKVRSELVLMACIGQGSFNIFPRIPFIGAKIERLITFPLILKKSTIPINRLRCFI